ncbi:hypothetical protein RsTz2092_06960 [Deferribacterales bacterium RsTz2092]|nr:hypothetical protein AGMMS49941_05110 [Deferribacterales bacterium]
MADYAVFFNKKLDIDYKWRLLARLTYADTITTDEMMQLLDGYDIEHSMLEYNLMLARFMKMQPSAPLPVKLKPRLQGVLRYFQYKNATQLTGFSVVGRALNKADIPVMLIKGALMRRVMPALPRVMGDVDFVVPYERYWDAVNVTRGLNFKQVHKFLLAHAADMYLGQYNVDIHRTIVKEGKFKSVLQDASIVHEIDREMFERAHATTAFGVECLLPTDEDNVFVCLANSYDAIRSQEKARWMWLWDIAGIVRDNKDFDWQKVLAIAYELRFHQQIKVMLEIFNATIPNVLPAGLIASIKTDEASDYSMKLDVMTCLIQSIKPDYRAIKFFKPRRPSKFIADCKLIWRYKYLKSVRNNVFLRNKYMDDIVSGTLFQPY